MIGMKITRLGVLAAVAAAAFASQGVSLPHVFGDNMVLQRGQRVPVWGKAAPGEKVTVEFAGQSVSATAGADGRWRLALEPLEASSAGAEFRVRGNGSVVFTNVVVGEVWFCSGQSNMEFTMSKNRKVKDWEKEVAAARWPLIRHFHPPHRVAYEPMDDVDASWVDTTPETIPPQSAVAFFFGETLHKELKVPVGLINCSWGGSRIEPWTPAGHPDDLWLMQNIREWNRAFDTPTVLWNGMVAGIAPYAIKGAIWYQGCANRADGESYLDKTVSLVRGWRREWGQGDFPYFLVQLAPFRYDNVKGTTLAVIQEAQARVPDKVPNSGCTVINDVGDVGDIHPTDKRTVGMRMADQVLDRVYGRFVRPWKTPVATGMKVEGSSVRVSFANADGLKTRDGLAPTEFEVRGLTGAWTPAAARIEGNDVVLAADGVGEPLGVRFAAYNGSTPNLVNGAGLPAGPFRIGRPCPFGAAEALAKSGGYTCVQRYDIPSGCDLRISAPKTLASVKDVDRVAYLLELRDKKGDTTYAFAEMDAFAADSDAMVLRADPSAKPVRALVSNLRVRTNSPRLRTADGMSKGFVELYMCNYGPATMSVPAGGDPRKFDYNDTPRFAPGNGLGYGCLQVHDLGAKATALAFNHFNAASVPCDVGIGNGTGDNPDWTFARNAGDYTARRLSVWVRKRTDLLHLSHVHRGGGKLERPDNTLETFKWCWENGSALECDCRKTRDGVGIMLHDRTLKRTGRGISPELAKKDVSKELSWAEVKDVDVGSYLKDLNPASADFSHHRIPTIEATFAAMKGHPTYLCFVDEKGAGPEYIAKKAVEAGVQDQVYYTGQDYSKAVEWTKILPGGKTLLWIGTWPVPKPEHNAADIARFEAHYEKIMAEVRAGGFRGVSAVSLHSYYNPKAKEQFVPRESYLRKLVEEFHSHGIVVCSIPFEGGDTEEVYFRLFDMGCDGFSTDYPSVMFSVIRKLKEGKRE